MLVTEMVQFFAALGASGLSFLALAAAAFLAAAFGSWLLVSPERGRTPAMATWPAALVLIFAVGMAVLNWQTGLSSRALATVLAPLTVGMMGATAALTIVPVALAVRMRPAAVPRRGRLLLGMVVGDVIAVFAMPAVDMDAWLAVATTSPFAVLGPGLAFAIALPAVGAVLTREADSVQATVAARMTALAAGVGAVGAGGAAMILMHQGMAAMGLQPALHAASMQVAWALTVGAISMLVGLSAIALAPDRDELAGAGRRALPAAAVHAAVVFVFGLVAGTAVAGV